MSIVFLGDDSQCGSYLLRIRLKKDKLLTFGGFKKGKLISMPAGDYVYVGSANAQRGATSLALRLGRHATRSGSKRNHAIRREMVKRFHQTGLGAGTPLSVREKHKHWNIDHFLDLSLAELTAVFVLRTEQPLERALAEFVEADPQSQIIEKGLGANDHPGHTHLLRIDAGDDWWRGLPERLSERFALHVR